MMSGMSGAWLRGEMPIKPVKRVREDGEHHCMVHGTNHGEAFPIYLVEHYIFPQVLQVVTLGEVKDNRNTFLCPTGAANVETLIEWVVEADPDGHVYDVDKGIPWTHRPMWCADAEVEMAELGLRRYFAALSGLSELRRSGAWAVHPNDWRCPDCGEGMVLTSPGRQNVWSHRCEGRSLRVDVDVPRTQEA